MKIVKITQFVSGFPRKNIIQRRMKMVEIDVDKILDQDEKKESQKRKKKKIMIASGIAGGAVAAVIIVIVTLNILKGTKSFGYFPADKGMKITYNAQGGYPEVWKFGDETITLGGYECAVLNRTDQGKFSQGQEYYHYGEKGIIKVGYSTNYGKKKKAMFRLLPGVIKIGDEFAAGRARGVKVTGKISGEETLSTPLGQVEALRVDYKGGSRFDRTIWFQKGRGIVKIKDRTDNTKIDIISAEGG